MLRLPVFRLDVPPPFRVPVPEPLKDRPVTGATYQPYFAWLERNTHVVYTGLMVLTGVLVLLGIFFAMRSHQLDPETRLRIKKNVIEELRRNVHGVSTETLSQLFSVDVKPLAGVLEEMEKDGMLVKVAGSGGRIIWCLVGTGAVSR